MTFDYKKYSLEKLEEWIHDAIGCDATADEIYNCIVNVVREEYYYHKDQTSRAYELLSKLNGHPTAYNWLNNKKTTSQNRGFEAVSGEDYVKNYYKNVMPSIIQRDIDQQKNLSCDKDDPSLECKGAWDSFWEDNQQYTEEELNAMCEKAELDAKVEQVRKEGGYGWTPDAPSQDKKYKDQNGVTYTEYLKAKIEANSAWNDGWTQEHYQKIVDKYEGKKTLNHDEAIAAGWTMTDDGIWMPPQV